MRLLEEHPGGIGYLLKERVLDGALLVDALRRLCDGETVVDPTIVARVSSAGAGSTRSPRSPSASARSWGCWPRGCRTGRSPRGCT